MTFLIFLLFSFLRYISAQDKVDPMIDRFEKIERKVVAWNDRQNGRI
jgi:hypothetical protein